MAPAAASLRSITSAAAASNKHPAASDADPLVQGDQEAARKNRIQQQQQLECPRCRSTNTKFCYYNNYSTAQPRHFCRACRRYWTQGGTLRNVPVGGASRRSGNKRRRAGSPEPSSASPPPPTSSDDACPGLPTFPFLTDGVFLPQLDLTPAAFSWPSAPVPDLYNNGLAPWGDRTTGPWDDITGLELSWPPMAGN